jgi:hypothetical protein|tara:strand:- start:1394 stop:1627 length:234 start_codon:yes stop_codon:yes gene_type:complete
MSSPIRLKQKLSPEAAKAKAERDLAAAKTPYRRFAKRDAQKKHRDNPGNSHLDYDHTTRSFVSVKKNRGGFGKGTKK